MRRPGPMALAAKSWINTAVAGIAGGWIRSQQVLTSSVFQHGFRDNHRRSCTRGHCSRRQYVKKASHYRLVLRQEGDRFAEEGAGRAGSKAAQSGTKIGITDTRTKTDTASTRRELSAVESPIVSSPTDTNLQSPDQHRTDSGIAQLCARLQHRCKADCQAGPRAGPAVLEAIHRPVVLPSADKVSAG
jgi:hypothetical protein